MLTGYKHNLVFNFIFGDIIYSLSTLRKRFVLLPKLVTRVRLPSDAERFTTYIIRNCETFVCFKFLELNTHTQKNDAPARKRRFLSWSCSCLKNNGRQPQRELRDIGDDHQAYEHHSIHPQHFLAGFLQTGFTYRAPDKQGAPDRGSA